MINPINFLFRYLLSRSQRRSLGLKPLNRHRNLNKVQVTSVSFLEKRVLLSAMIQDTSPDEDMYHGITADGHEWHADWALPVEIVPTIEETYNPDEVFVPDDTESNNTIATAQSFAIAFGDIISTSATSWSLENGNITNGDVDYYSFVLSARSGVFFDIDAVDIGLSTLNSALTVFNGAGTSLGTNDDGFDFQGFSAPITSSSTRSRDASLYLELEAGTYYVQVDGIGTSTGNYQFRALADSGFATTVPIFHSLQGAADTLYLDFDGHAATDSWGTYTANPFILSFNTNTAEYSPGERLAIYNTWRVTSEDFSPFQINVTTADPGSFNNGQAMRLVLTSSSPSIVGQSTGILGVAFLRSYAGSAVNTAFTWASNFSSFSGGSSGEIMAASLERGNTTSHEFGHALNLHHYSTTSTSTAITFIENGIMSTPDRGLNREIWATGTAESTLLQDDDTIISNLTNTFGYRADDHGNTTSTATLLTSSLKASGIIENVDLDDVDVFRFLARGNTTISANVNEYIANLHPRVELLDALGNVLQTASGATANGDAIITTALLAGTYYARVRSAGAQGSIGQYELVVTTSTTPEISVLNGTSGINDGTGSVNFGATQVGSNIDKVLTITNTGIANLTLGIPNITGPFSLVGSFPSSVGIGASATFTLRLTASTVGSANGTISFTNNDGDENPFNFALTGTVNPVTVPEIEVLNGTTNIPDETGTVNFGTTTVGTTLSKTFTINNTGTAALTLGFITVPTGFSVLAQPPESIAAGSSGTFTIQLDASAVGSPNGTLSFTTNDSDENPFNFTLSGIVDPVPEPEIKVLDGSVELFDDLSTIDFGISTLGTSVARTLTVTNTGNLTLNLGSIIAPNGFTVSIGGPTSLNPGESTQITIRFNASEDGTSSGTLLFTSNDTDEADFTLTLTGITITPAASLQLIVPLYKYPLTAPNTLDTWWESIVNLANTARPITVIINPANGPIDSSDPGTLATDYANYLYALTQFRNNSNIRILGYVSTDYANRSLAEVQADIAKYAIGYKHTTSGQSLIDGIFLDEMSLDVGDVGHYSQIASTIRSTNGLNNRFVVGNPGTDLPLDYLEANVADIFVIHENTFDNFQTDSTPGYVSSTTYNHLGFGAIAHTTIDENSLYQALNLASSRGYNYVFVTNGDDPDGTVDNRYNQIPSFFNQESNWLINPEITVLEGTTNIPDDTGTVNFGTTILGTVIDKTFTINNTGSVALNLGTVTVPTGFTVVSPPPASVAAGSSATFTVRLTAAAVGNFSGSLSFTTNDSDENPFNFTITGVVNATAAPVVQIIDDGDAGFSTTGNWILANGQGRGSDVLYSAKGTGADVASWAFTGLTAGQYRISATWSTLANRATNSPFTVRTATGGTILGSRNINQELAPNDFSDSGSAWEDIATINLTGSSLVVELSDLANEFVIADAIRIERLGDVPNVPEIAVLEGTTNIPDDTGTVNFGTTILGTIIDKTFTINNTGSAALTLGTVTVPTGFTVVSPPPASVAAGSSATFTVRLTAAAVGNFSGSLSFTTNDSDKNPFNFTITGVVNATAAPVVQIIDDGDAGFSTTGNWILANGQGRGSDVLYSAKGTGADVARWNFTGLAAGTYNVYATWSPLSNRASNAPYTIRDGLGGSILGSAAVDQRQTPSDLTVDGSRWKLLATITITGSSLIVELSDLANNNVIADAIRIESV